MPMTDPVESIFSDSTSMENEPNEEIIPLVKEGKELLEILKFSEAEQQFSEALKLNPNEPSANMGKGISLLEMKKFKDAIPYFESVTKYVDPKKFLSAITSAHLRLGECYLEIKEWDKSLHNFAESEKYLYEDLAQKGGEKKTAETYPELMPLYKQIGNVQFMKAKVLAKLRRFEEEIVCYAEQSRFFPKEIAPYANQGSAYLSLQRSDKALECFEKAVQLKPDMWLLLYLKGRALYRLDRYEEATEVLEQSLLLNPNQLKATKMIDMIKLEQKQQTV